MTREIVISAKKGVKAAAIEEHARLAEAAGLKVVRLPRPPAIVKPVIIAIDPGSNLGWAMSGVRRMTDEGWEQGDHPTYGVLRLGKYDWPGRVSEMVRHLDLLRRYCPPNMESGFLVIEQFQSAPDRQNRPNLHLLERYVGAAMVWTASHGFIVVEANQNQWKAALGSGRMDKAQYSKAVKGYFGLRELPPHDAAAALGMLAFALRRVKIIQSIAER